MKNIKPFISKALLNIANIFPEKSKGYISFLQHLRKHQIEAAEKAYKRSKPPEKFSYELTSIRIIELFPIENFDLLQKSLLEVFSAQEADSSNISQYISQRSTKLLGTSWRNIGKILRNERKGPYSTNTPIIKSLPEEVNYVHVGLHQIVPSFFVLTLDAILNEKATEELRKIREDKPVAPIIFKQFIPRGREKHFHSSEIADNKLTSAINSYLASIRARTIKELKKLVKAGLFTSHNYELPYIETFILDGLPDTRSDILEWVKKNHGWWRAFGFNLVGYYYYLDSKFIYIFGDKHRVSGKRSHRLILNKSKIIKKDDKENSDVNPYRLANIMRDKLSSINSTFSIISFLRFAEQKIGHYRKSASELHIISPVWPFHLINVFRLHNSIEKLNTLFNRLELEYNQIEDWIRKQLEDVQELKNTMSSDLDDNKNLKNAFLSRINFQIDILGKHLKLTTDSFSRYTSIINTTAIYILTWVGILLGTIEVIQTGFISQLHKHLVVPITEFFVYLFGNIIKLILGP